MQANGRIVRWMAILVVSGGVSVNAFAQPETVDDLFAYVNGRLSQVSTVSVYHRDDVPSLVPSEK